MFIETTLIRKKLKTYMLNQNATSEKQKVEISY